MSRLSAGLRSLASAALLRPAAPVLALAVAAFGAPATAEDAPDASEWISYVSFERLAEDRARDRFAGFERLQSTRSRSIFRATCEASIDPRADLSGRYADNALAPLAVSVLSWREDYERGGEARLDVGIVNDTARAQSIDLRMFAVLPDGKVASASALRRLSLAAGGREIAGFSLEVPRQRSFVLVAEGKPQSPWLEVVRSYRKIGFGSPAAAIPTPPFESSCCQSR